MPPKPRSSEAHTVAHNVVRLRSVPRAPELPRRSLLPRVRGARQTELHELRLAPHAEGLTYATKTHSTESLLVTVGQLVVSYAGEQRTLSAGEEIAIPAGVERRYFNPGELTTVAYAKLQPHA